MAIGSSYIWILNLNVNGLNFPIKRLKVTEWIKNSTQLYYAHMTFILSSSIFIGSKCRNAKRRQGRYTLIRHKRLQLKKNVKRQRKLYNVKGVK